MIRSVRIRNWRSYASLDLKLGRGTTFVVAANGVGKTSLILALAWAVFGSEAQVDEKSCIRIGETEAEVSVEVELPDGRILTIERRAQQRGRSKSRGVVDGVELKDVGISEILERSFGVELAVAARLALMLGGSHLADERELDLKSHLHRVFGVDGLVQAADVARRIAKQAEKARAAVRAVAEERLADRGAVETEVEALGRRLAELRARADSAQGELRRLEGAQQIIRAQAEYAKRRSAYDEEVRSALNRAAGLFAEPVSAPTTEEMVDELGHARETAEQAAQRHAQGRAEALGNIRAAEEGLRLLTGAVARCPACLREIDDESLVSARQQHELRLQSGATSARDHEAAEVDLRSRISAIVDAVASLRALRPPAPPDRAEEEVSDANIDELRHAQLERIQKLHEEIGAVEGRQRELAETLRADEAVAQSRRELHVAYRREGIAAASAQALERLCVDISQRCIEPVADEVRRRWRSLFSTEGLTLRPDGRIVRVINGRELGWDTLSGGERIWARIVTHLLVVTSFTSLPFVWLDEPLEHLDPTLRRAVAATLATATSGGRPQQLLVTTYENGLAARLASDTEGVSLVAVRAGAPRDDPGASPDWESEARALG